MNKQNTKKPASPETPSLRVFFIDALKDIYWAEKNLCMTIPQMVKKSTSSVLREVLENHLGETENQMVRLEQVFASIDENPVAKRCEAMEGIIREAELMMNETNNGTKPLDAAIIASVQKIEQHEIAAYGTLRTIAEVLGFNQASELLTQTLEEEKKADQKLTEIAESYIKQSALNQGN
ncbi:MAG: ferritin-like domain-containing protein [Daejeonella sp.]